ncbi:uncharacterized protein METZ01_LOCUS57142 [marine metagenome]|jgi:hypothetical protein|uniref:Uncharacterized protein n=1 Tax=marine metagenome TaxID=408172 RepID=A0A381SLX6_9ZZZZ
MQIIGSHIDDLAIGSGGNPAGTLGPHVLPEVVELVFGLRSGVHRHPIGLRWAVLNLGGIR